MPYRQDLFLETVRHLRGGRTQEELSQKLAQLGQDCRATGKQGTLTLTIKVKPDKGDTGQYFFEDDVKTVEPKFDRGQTIFFGTPEGNFQRTDPNQSELPLRDVNAKEEAPRKVTEDNTPARTVG